MSTKNEPKMSPDEFKMGVVAGGQPLAVGSGFTADAQHFVVPYNNQLKVYFITSRQCIRSIKLQALDGVSFEQLVDIRPDRHNGNLLWCFMADGQVVVLNWKEKLVDPVVNRFKLDCLGDGTADSLVLKVFGFKEDQLGLVIGKKASSKPHTRSIVRVEYKLSDDNTMDLQYTELAQLKNVVQFASSPRENKLAFLVKSPNSLVLFDNDLTNTNVVEPELKHNINVIAVSNDGIVALGTTNGVIELIYQDLSKRYLKWHIDQVKALSFDKDTKYLLSGGLEKVLVFWQLDTEKQQFLPRLNGEITSISYNNNNNTKDSEELFQITLKIDEKNPHYEILVLSSVDLQSRLSINGPKQTFNSDKKNLRNKSKLLSNQQVSGSKFDFTSSLRIHPTSKQLYFTGNSSLQIYDIYKNEQISLQTITDHLQIGKVRSELKLRDPVVRDLCFTADGRWMATVEEIQHGEVDNLLSRNDLTVVLKIWKLSESNSWELVTKIFNPHGSQTAILSLIPAPKSYFGGLGFLTADFNGGVRLWRPNNEKHLTSWSLRKLKSSTGIKSSAISLHWNEDSSLIFLGFDNTISVIDTETFEEIENEFTQTLYKIAGSRIRFLSTINNNLIILTKDSLKSIDLLTLEENELSLALQVPRHASNIIDVNESKGLVSIAVNYFNENKELNSKLFIFNSFSKKPLFVGEHNSFISAIQHNADNEIVFIDIDSKIGIVSNSKINSENLEELNSIDFAKEMSILLNNATTTAAQLASKQSKALDNSDEINTNKLLDINTFNNLFENIEGIQLETLFERVIQIIQ